MLSMGHVGASGKSSTNPPWEMLSKRLSRPIYVPLLTVVLPWSGDKKPTSLQKTQATQLSLPAVGPVQLRSVGMVQHYTAR